MAQLVARLVRIEEVGVLNPLSSTLVTDRSAIGRGILVGCIYARRVIAHPPM